MATNSNISCAELNARARHESHDYACLLVSAYYVSCVSTGNCCAAAQVTETIAGYYKRIDPPDAAVLVKQLQPDQQQQGQEQEVVV
jgi:hypothetical protein